MQQFDQAPVKAESIEGSLATVVKGNTAPKAFSVGEYIYLKQHSSLKDGLLRVKAAIASGDALTTSNLERDLEGVVNALNEKIPSVVNDLSSDSTTSALSAAQGKALNSNLTATNNRTLTKRYYIAYTVNNTNVSWSWGTGYLQLVGDVLFLSTGISPSAASNDWLNLLTLQSDYKPTYEVRCVATAEDGSETRLVRVTTDGKIDILKPNAKAYWFEIFWLRNISN